MVPALFLDRDGVINVDTGYLHRPEECRFVPGIFELVGAANRAGYRVLIVTNQSGVGRGYFSEEVFRSFTEWMIGEFKRRGLSIDGVYFCPHHPDAPLDAYRVACACRKPEPGMFLSARDEFDVDMHRSIMVGDSRTDIEAAHAGGVGRAFLLVDPSQDGGLIDDCTVIHSLDEVLQALADRTKSV
ncbi:D,D-heptose 1,7-bisphosphate phosphatase [Burkholderia cepacia]|uniref:D,D-heptose 1,7-bisphosphate phosphatase n=2 Tax=Burkholderia cepacia complex TaxID=87882 RepID=A0A1B4PPN0_BURCE|nr:MULTISPECIES: D-glycero-beta-D-manno-heptose 1,7-bisphosphate 7-phosphatase [Burkholderia cepacia complex]AOK15893.1 D,D-heptose 1,7-bisphosphate phosphatase [Burkholderia cepacia]AOK22619.1 D,D-heptose 1,7-bisphosphate phosphatase [Burkholderia ubonensis]